MSSYFKDQDPQETQDWIDSLKGVIQQEGGEKADYLLGRLTEIARSLGVSTSPGLLTPYCNTIAPERGRGHARRFAYRQECGRLCALERHGHGGQSQ